MSIPIPAALLPLATLSRSLQAGWRLAAAAALAAATLFGPGAALAQSATAAAPDWSGSVGFGPALVPRYIGSRSMQWWAIPVMSVTYKETLYLDFARAGVYVWSSADKTMALSLAGEPRWGRAAGDGSRLTGTETRRTRAEAGPSLDWQTPLADFNLAWFRDISHTGGGSSLRLGGYREFTVSERLKLGAMAGIDRVNARTVDYYFGVRPGEVVPGRPLYSGTSGTDVSVGFDGSYGLGGRQSVVFGANFTRLNDSAAASPVVETRRVRFGWVGLSWDLQ